MMNKIIVVAFAISILFLFSACGQSTDFDVSIPSSQSSTTSGGGNEKPESTVSTGTSSTAEGDSVQDERIKLSFDDEAVIVRMYDNPASRDLLAKLPLTLNFEDYAGAEKIAYPPEKLSTEDAPLGADPKKGDLAVYAPWGNLAVYYQDRGYANGLIILGHIESGIEKLSSMKKDFTVTIERLSESGM